MAMTPTRFFAPQVWLQGGWAQDVLLRVNASGMWCGIQPNTRLAERQGATRLNGPVLPGLVNAHLRHLLQHRGQSGRRRV